MLAEFPTIVSSSKDYEIWYLEKTYHAFSKLENKYLFIGRRVISEDQRISITSISMACANDPRVKRKCSFTSCLQ